MKFLRGSFLWIAQKLQEAADLTASDVASRLSDQIQDDHRRTGHYANYHDHMGDDKSGHVIYSVDGNAVKAPYEMSKDGDGAAKTHIHSDKAVNVVPRTTWEPEADDDELDEYAKMMEAGLYTRTRRVSAAIPLCERKIAKSERDAADSSSFAGKGKSFPILKAEDVDAAVHSLGRAGSANYSTDVIRANIKKIAKRKGFPLPKSMQDEEAPAKEAKKSAMKDCPDCDGDGKCDSCNGMGKSGDKDCPDCGGTGDCDTCDGDGEVPMAATTESRRAEAAGGLRLVERTSWPTDEILDLIESASGTEIPIKIIAPGKGSSAFYTPEALQRAASDGLFDDAQIYINHATRAQESERPEGDYRDLAGAIKSGSVAWHESHKRGPGLYGTGLFTPQIAPEVRSKAAISGMSIRANGVAAESNGRPKIREGLPVLERFTSVESVDLVTRAGAGGMVLEESARRRTEESTMNATEKRLLESLVRESLRNKAITEGARLLAAVSLTEGQREYIMDTVMERSIPTTADGDLDAKKFREALSAELSRFGAALGNRQMVQGMGAGAPVELTEADRTAITEREKAGDAMYTESWKTLLGTADIKVAEAAYRGRAN